jgi:hypothetical protein
MFIEELKLGDRFRFPHDTLRVVYGPVRDAETDYAGCTTSVDFGGGRHTERAACTRVEIVTRAPKCGCRKFLVWCENECPWPAEMADLWGNR